MYSKPQPSARPGADRFQPAPSPRARRAGATKEALTAWERWEMTAIAGEPAALTPADAPAPEAVVAPLAPPVLISEAELDRLREEARHAGHAQGLQQGYAEGHGQGCAAAMAEVRAEAQQLHTLATALPQALRDAQSEVAADLLALALDIARQVLGQALALDTGAILPVVRELLQAEPALSGAPQLRLHPDDAALVQQHLADDLQAAGWRIRSDANCQRGGCRVLATSGEQDASVPSRWDRVTSALIKTAMHTPASHHG